jgi:hypothetical protein
VNASLGGSPRNGAAIEIFARLQETHFEERLRMKTRTAFITYIATSVFIATTLLSAQQSAPPAGNMNMSEEQVNDANIELMRQDIRSQRKKVVAANMPLTDTEATKFWPVYDRYVGETIKVNDGRFALLKEYANNYDTGTEEQADNFIKRWLAFDQDTTQLRLKYIPEFEKVISHKKTAICFQIDRRVSMMIELQLASQVPLVKP